MYISAAVKNIYQGEKSTAIDGEELKENLLRAFMYVFFILAM
jgi:hypothetical protein